MKGGESPVKAPLAQFGRFVFAKCQYQRPVACRKLHRCIPPHYAVASIFFSCHRIRKLAASYLPAHSITTSALYRLSSEVKALLRRLSETSGCMGTRMWLGGQSLAHLSGSSRGRQFQFRSSGWDRLACERITSTPACAMLFYQPDQDSQP